MVFPFYWMIITAMKTSTELSIYPPALFPQSFNLNNFQKVINETDFLSFFSNSATCAFVETIILLIVTIMSAYAFFRFKIKGKKYILPLLMLTNAIPFEVVMVFNYKMLVSWGIYDNIWAIMIPFLCNFTFTYILYDAFCSIPKDLVYASVLDKASHYKFIRYIAIPYAKTAIIYIAIMNIVGSWNSFVWPMLITNTTNSRTLPLAIYTFMPEYGSRTELVMAMSVLSELPMALLFVVFQKTILKNTKV